MPLVNTRYAEALIELFEEKGSTDEVLNNLRTVLGLFKDNPGFNSFLLDPQIHVDSRKKALKDVLENQIENELMNFLMLLIDKGRLKYLGGIVDEYTRMADERKNILKLKIISAAPLEDAQIDSIKEIYMKMYKKNAVKAELQIDKSLIGGVKIQIGDRVIDDSIKARLMNLKEMMIKQ